jgi:hypothetical protein
MTYEAFSTRHGACSLLAILEFGRVQVRKAGWLAVSVLIALPAATGFVAARDDVSCVDTSAHKATFITVARGVRLEVLDWGGTGDPMVLLTGSGDNAHVFDEFAFQFTDRLHVIGITRRGFGRSSQPASGYDLDTRAHDDIAVLDSLGIGQAIFVGHSIRRAYAVYLTERGRKRLPRQERSCDASRTTCSRRCRRASGRRWTRSSCASANTRSPAKRLRAAFTTFASEFTHASECSSSRSRFSGVAATKSRAGTSSRRARLNPQSIAYTARFN